MCEIAPSKISYSENFSRSAYDNMVTKASELQLKKKYSQGVRIIQVTVNGPCTQRYRLS